MTFALLLGGLAAAASSAFPKSVSGSDENASMNQVSA
jgi:hypothetical protein